MKYHGTVGCYLKPSVVAHAFNPSSPTSHTLPPGRGRWISKFKVGLSKFKAGLVYIVNSTPAKAT